LKKIESTISERLRDDNSWKILLLIYYFVLIGISLFFLIGLWKPIDDTLLPQTGNVTKVNTTTIIPQLTNQKAIVAVPNGTNAGNVTIVSTTTMPAQLINQTGVLTKVRDHETRLVMWSLLFGILGASVQGMTSLAAWQSTKKLEKSFFFWYLTRPPIGAALAVIVYMAIRAGLIQGGTLPASAAISDFGVAAISGLIGLLTTPVTKKLRDVFDVLFGIIKHDDKGDKPTTTPTPAPTTTTTTTPTPAPTTTTTTTPTPAPTTTTTPTPAPSKKKS
jgi:hypothetical protein